MNPFETLEVSPGATAEEIKAAYHRLAKTWHPDRFSGPAKSEAEERFRLLAEAFNQLKDSGRREELARIHAQAAPGPRASQGINLSAAPPAPAPEVREREKTVDDWYRDAKAAFDAKSYDHAMGLIQYAIRLDGSRGEFHALFAQALDAAGGDRRVLVKTLETALRLNPKDVDSTLRLADTFQGLGMTARASKLRETARTLSPNHPAFRPEKKQAQPTGKASANTGDPSLVEQAKTLINKILKRG
jgi:curved DNA-binding protein CbpA